MAKLYSPQETPSGEGVIMSVRIWLQKDAKPKWFASRKPGFSGTSKSTSTNPQARSTSSSAWAWPTRPRKFPKFRKRLWSGWLLRGWSPYERGCLMVLTIAQTQQRICSYRLRAVPLMRSQSHPVAWPQCKRWLYRVLLSRGRSMHEPNLATLLSHDVERDRDKEHGKGCFAPIPGFRPSNSATHEPIKRAPPRIPSVFLAAFLFVYKIITLNISWKIKFHPFLKISTHFFARFASYEVQAYLSFKASEEVPFEAPTKLERSRAFLYNNSKLNIFYVLHLYIAKWSG